MTLFEALSAKSEQRRVLVRMPYGGTGVPGTVIDIEPIYGRGGKYGALVRWEVPTERRGVSAVIPLQRVAAAGGGSC
jgi:hypothetical protein